MYLEASTIIRTGSSDKKAEFFCKCLERRMKEVCGFSFSFEASRQIPDADERITQQSAAERNH
jgi:hypothetical protein